MADFSVERWVGGRVGPGGAKLRKQIFALFVCWFWRYVKNHKRNKFQAIAPPARTSEGGFTKADGLSGSSIMWSEASWPLCRAHLVQQFGTLSLAFQHFSGIQNMSTPRLSWKDGSSVRDPQCQPPEPPHTVHPSTENRFHILQCGEALGDRG